MLAVNGKAKVWYPASLVHWEILAEAKLEVVNPETVRALEELERPLPKRLLKD